MVATRTAPTIGILAVQGGFADHAAQLTALDARWRYVRTAADLDSCAALILPGGESTTQSHLLRSSGLDQVLLEFARMHPLLGTCAGMILMGHGNDSRVLSLQLLDAQIERNAYGRQRESFSSLLDIALPTAALRDFTGIFIRAPRIHSVGPDVDVLARHNGQPVLIRQGLHMGMSFHPELTCDPRLHAAWLQLAFERHDNPRALRHAAH